MILVSGFNVFPNEIEDIVSRFNRVMECAVIGIPSDSTGEAVKLYVVKKDPSLTAQEIKQYCRAYLTPYKVPRVIQFVDSLPKSPLGKVLRRKLRDMEGPEPLTAEQQLENIKRQEQEQLAQLKAQQELMQAYAQDQANSKQEQASSALIDANALPTEGKTHIFTKGFGYIHSKGKDKEQQSTQIHDVHDNSAMLNAVIHAFSSHTASGTTHKTNYRFYESTLESQKQRGSSAYVIRTGENTNQHHADYGVTTNANLAADNSSGKLSQEQWQRLENALQAHHVDSEQDTASNESLSDKDQESQTDSVVKNLPKSKGALALERLLSSHGIDDLGAATTTPNIHRKEQKSNLVTGPESSRIHVGKAAHDNKLDH